MIVKTILLEQTNFIWMKKITWNWIQLYFAKWIVSLSFIQRKLYTEYDCLLGLKFVFCQNMKCNSPILRWALNLLLLVCSNTYLFKKYTVEASLNLWNIYLLAVAGSITLSEVKNGDLCAAVISHSYWCLSFYTYFDLWLS